MQKYYYHTALSILTGLAAGVAAALFLYLLDWATQAREAQPLIIWVLPVAGFIIGWIFHHYGRNISEGNNLVIDEMYDPKKVIPFKMAPFILGGTILTHLFGGSAGREGTAVQMGASLADQVSKFFKINPQQRKFLLRAGAGAGFGAAIGTPMAGMIFGLEVAHGKLKLEAWWECAVASFVAYFTSIMLQSPHSVFPTISVESFSLLAFGGVLIAGAAFGLAARFFMLITHVVEKVQTKLWKYSPLKPFFGGLLLVILFYIEGSYRYVGLGIPVIQESLSQNVSWLDPLYKTLFTAITIGSGFKGGEFIPLVFIGSSLGNVMAEYLNLSPSLLAALGFAAVFGGAARTPVACSVMAMELFGWSIAPYALTACVASFIAVGKHSIYKRPQGAR